MTRETKIGLIVAGSFLCLVCVVVASKWNRGNDPSKEPEQQEVKVAAAKPMQNTSEPKKKDAAPKSDGSPRVEFAVMPPRPETKGSTPAPAFPPPPVLTISPTPELPTAVKPLEVPMLPSRFEAPKPAEIPKPPGGFDISKPAEIPMPPLITVGSEGDKKVPLLVPPPIPPVDEKKGLAFPEAVKPGNPATIEFPPAIERPAVIPVAKPEAPPAPLQFTDKSGPPMFPSLPKDGAPMFPPLPKDGAPMVPTLTTPTPVTKESVPVPPKFGDTVELVPPGPLPKIPPQDLSSTPPIALPGVAKPMPVVTDTDPYVCQAGDTSFAILSQRFYSSDKYADALLAYNRENYKLIKNGLAFLGNPPSLMPGQHVEHPPVAVLERSYGNWIRAGNASAIPTIPPAGSAIKIATPVPLAATPTAGIPKITTPTSAGRTYTVQTPGGESIFDVAERTLGNRSAWPEIWRVNQGNPAVRPPAPIPMGTELKLP